MSLGNEAVEGSKMGTQLIMFVAIVAIALAAFLVGKGLVNSGLDNMETTVGKVNDSRFSDYNNKVVRGRAVKQALENFASEEVAILINNLAFNGVSTTQSELNFSAVAGAVNADKTNYFAVPISTDLGASASGQYASGYTTNGQNCAKVRYMNYNAVLTLNPEATGAGRLVQSGDASYKSIYKDSTTGGMVFTSDFLTGPGGDITYYLVTTPLQKKGDVQYVADSASYQASLIRNAAGEIMGIVFTQRKIS